MSWTRPADLRTQVQKLWDKGLLLASLATGASLFPRRLILKKPSSTQLADRFEDVRTWIADLRKGTNYRVVMRDLRHHIIGMNSVPDEIWIDTVEDALSFIGKSRDATRFSTVLAITRERQPVLEQWLAKRPLNALDLSEVWSQILDIVEWIQTHPRPGIYLRQMDIPGVHTKFIEAHRAVLIELLDLVLSPEAIDVHAVGTEQFPRRYGFLNKPLRIHFRILDPAIALLPGEIDQYLAVNQDVFSRLDLNISRVFITENEINFLSFPNLQGSMVIFGAGYGFEMLAKAKWLNRTAMYYWGDIDTHGFAILDQLRAYFPHAESFLMDRKTLIAHEPQWVTEPHPVRRALARLDADERELYDHLCDDSVGHAVRLEQEKIRFSWVTASLENIIRPGDR